MLKDELGSWGGIAHNHTSLMGFEMTAGHIVVRAGHDSVMKLPTPESWIEGCDIPENTDDASVPLP